MQFTPSEIQQVCQLVNQLTGIQWDTEKTYLIESRFGKLMHEHRIESLTDLVHQVNSTASVRTDFIDSVTTRETLFFRDDGPFNALQHKALPEIIDAKSNLSHPQRLRIWSAACSSGQEPYSIGIVLHELLEDIDDWDIKILATDLAPAALQSASLGVYSDFEMSRGVPEKFRDKYFVQVANGWKICDRVRNLVSFENRNLLEPFTNIGPFDVIFCRNVAIYFDESIKRDLFDRLSGVLSPHGAIFVGSSETLNSLGARWKPQHHCRGTFYQPNRSTTSHSTEAARQSTKKADAHHRDLVAKSTTNLHSRGRNTKSATIPVRNNARAVLPPKSVTPNRTASLPTPPLKTDRAPNRTGIPPHKAIDKKENTGLLSAIRSSSCRTLTGDSTPGRNRANTALIGDAAKKKIDSASSRVILSVTSPADQKKSVSISCNEIRSTVRTSLGALSSCSSTAQAAKALPSSVSTPLRTTLSQYPKTIRPIPDKSATNKTPGKTTIRPSTAVTTHLRTPIHNVKTEKTTPVSPSTSKSTPTGTTLRTELLRKQNGAVCTTSMKSLASLGKPKVSTQTASCLQQPLNEQARQSKFIHPTPSVQNSKGRK